MVSGQTVNARRTVSSSSGTSSPSGAPEEDPCSRPSFGELGCGSVAVPSGGSSSRAVSSSSVGVAVQLVCECPSWIWVSHLTGDDTAQCFHLLFPQLEFRLYCVERLPKQPVGYHRFIQVDGCISIWDVREHQPQVPLRNHC
ncbi:hypothetical protein XENOCAPTIV_011937 [Xenoophorus captivus]|uniref:Uncharacterized protein n=1 Tax=Xenoophorus captivus TaxID=1517983 RepID=A0ABV0SFJ6_9TELE